MKTLKNEWLQILLLAAPLCVAALLWNKLPERIPVHWNIHGQVDGYGSRLFGALFLPAINIVVVLLVWVCSKIDPRIRRQSEEARASSLRVFRAIRLALTLFLSGVCVTMLCIAVGLPLDMSRIIGCGLAVLFLVLGNVMGKIRPNYFAGIRTPWTLESTEVWQKTHRLAGKIMVAGSVLLVVASLVLPVEAILWCMLPLLGVMTLTPAVYSYVIYKKLQPV